MHKKFIGAIRNSAASIFKRVNADGDYNDPHCWMLEAVPDKILSTSDGLFVLKAINILSNGSIRDCFIDMVMPERISDYVYFIDELTLKFGYWHECPGEVVCAVPINHFGSYEIFYSKSRPDIGIEVLKRGLQLTKNKGYIALDLGYILRDEGKYNEAVEAFLMAASEDAGSPYVYLEISQCYEFLKDDEKRIYFKSKFDDSMKRI